MAICRLCPRRCGVDRSVARGFCGMGESPVIARAALHHWEEPPISGTRGSGAVFFCGCTLRCIFCQNMQISRGGCGVDVGVDGLRARFARLKQVGAHNINLVTPTHFLPAILKALEDPPGLPVVMNTGGYELAETIRMLEGRFDIFLPDLKYCDGDTARRFSGAEDYFEHASGALKEMAKQAGAPVYDADGIMQRGIIVRHLVLPGHLGNTVRALRFIKDELPAGTPVSLMAQYTPVTETPYRELNRRLSQLEYDTVLNQMIKLGLDGFIQEVDSAGESYIPAFGAEQV